MAIGGKTLGETFDRTLPSAVPDAQEPDIGEREPLEDRDFSNPQFSLRVNGFDVMDLAPIIQHLEYESADGMVDMLKLKILNIDGRLTGSKLIMPGNEVDVGFGYGKTEWVGRAFIVRPEWDFPESGSESIEITGYTIDHKMMDDAPDKDKERFAARKAAEANKAAGGKGKVPKKRIWATPLELVYVLGDVLKAYPVAFDFDNIDLEKEIGLDGLIQKAGMSDYDLLKGLANITGFVMWADFDFRSDIWMVHFRNPKNVIAMQQNKLTFHYRRGQESTLKYFKPTISTRDMRTKIVIEWLEPKTRKLMTGTFQDDVADPVDIVFKGDPFEQVKGSDFKGPSSVKLFWGDFSHELFFTRPFTSEKALRYAVAKWFQDHREHFIIAEGGIIGVPSLRARQVHAFKGLGPPFDGDYYFIQVRHMFDASSGYTCEFGARKIVDSNGDIRIIEEGPALGVVA